MEKCRDPVTGKVMESQVGENFSVIGNHFIGEMKKDAIHIRSYNNVKHRKCLSPVILLIKHHKLYI